MTSQYDLNNCFTLFKDDISSIKLPEKFTYPFYYTPHPLCIAAAQQLQNHLLTQQDWKHDFGIEHHVDGSNIGKMFGVLVVKKENGELGFLSAFSGKLAESNLLPGFVPPIYDLLDPNGFFKIEEDNISAINHQIKAQENDKAYLQCLKKNETERLTSEKELKEYRQFMKAAKDNRKAERNKALETLAEEDFKVFNEQLKNESLKHQYDYKQLKKRWEIIIKQNHEKLDVFKAKISSLKEERKRRSAALQQKLFDQYQFLNKNGETIGVSEIFANTPQLVPRQVQAIVPPLNFFSLLFRTN